MLKRRDFLKNSGAVALGGLVLQRKFGSSFFKDQIERPVGLQLYTLMNVIDNDVTGTLKKVAAIGYTEIESAFSKKGGYYGFKAKEFASLLIELGLRWRSHHVLGAPFKLPRGTKLPRTPGGKPMVIPPMKNLRENYQEIIDDVAEADLPYLVCASTPIDSLKEIKKSIKTLNKASEACKKAGVVLAYHNHDAEFKPVEGKIPYDLLLSQTNPDLLKMEIDLAWATKAGVDPVELFEKNPGRFHLWHVKDIAADKQTIKPVGEGIVDFRRIFVHTELAGMKHFFVEHDMPEDPFKSITTSFNNIKKILGETVK